MTTRALPEDADIPTLEAERRFLIEKRNGMQAAIDALTARIQAQCCHAWKLHQIVGEGRYCIHCGYWDTDFDD